QQLAASAANVDEVGGRAENGQVILNPRPDFVLGAAETILELHVGHAVDRSAERRRRRSAGGAGSRVSLLDGAFQQQQTLFRERETLPKVAAAKTAVLAVDVHRDGLEVLDEQRFEPFERAQFAADRTKHPAAGLHRFPMRGGIAIEMIDERGVEPLLRFERRANHPPPDPPKRILERAALE